jgi:hypothetical protein
VAKGNVQAVTSSKESGGRRLTALRRAGRAAAGSRVARHLAVLACYLAAGVAVTWPRATWLADGKLPATRDGGSYVWGFWWMARQVEHLADPWFTRFIAAPPGAELGYHALMPLEGVVMMPVTVAFGPSASYNVLSIALPGLVCYAMYRAALLWLRTQAGAIAAGAFFGLSTMLTWQSWYLLNIAAGALFLPLTLEAALRLRRHPGWRQAVILGIVLGGSLLTDQESAVLVGILAAAVLVPWLAGRPAPRGDGEDEAAARGPSRGRKLAAAAAAAAVAALVASPQIAAMVVQARSGGASFPQRQASLDYVRYSSFLPWMFEVSPRAVRLGLTALKSFSYPAMVGPRRTFTDGVPTFGLVLTILTVLGLIVSWRRRSAWMLALLWLAGAALALGPTLKIGTHSYVPAAEVWHGLRVSAVLPYTWFVRVPGLSGFREATRILALAMVPAALLAGAAVEWLFRRSVVLIVPVLILGGLEAGWAGNLAIGTMRTALPGLDGPIAADRSHSLVVDVPFGIRGGIAGLGAGFDPEAQVLATADGHPRAVGYLSRIPAPTLAAVRQHAFYEGLLSAQGSQPRRVSEALTHSGGYPALLAAARLDSRRMNVGWVLVWQQKPAIRSYLARTGFRFDYAADGVLVYRPAGAPGSRT